MDAELLLCEDGHLIVEHFYRTTLHLEKLFAF